MSFADKYFSRVNTYNYSIAETPKKDLKLIIVIPVFNEPKLIKTVKSILNNHFNGFYVEIIFVVNSFVNSSKEILIQNQKSINELETSFEINENEAISMHIIRAENLPAKVAGPGIARKIGMDEALRRFNEIENPNGIIVSLDADTIVEENYIRSIFDFYKQNPKICGANISFAHQIVGNEFSDEIYKAIIIYEIYLRYYIQALRYINFPYSFHTIGSAFSVNAQTYAKQGGMVVKQSGEDFYFLQKIIPSCQFAEIKSTTVHPSPRITDRVIFGTGVAVEQIINSNNFNFQTYQFNSFLILKTFFEQIDDLFQTKKFNEIIIDKNLKDYLLQNKIEQKIEEIKTNTSNLSSFKKRFFNWFNAFRILKFLNFYHSNFVEKKSVINETKKLIMLYDKKISGNNIEILQFLRDIQ